MLVVYYPSRIVLGDRERYQGKGTGSPLSVVCIGIESEPDMLPCYPLPVHNQYHITHYVRSFNRYDGYIVMV